MRKRTDSQQPIIKGIDPLNLSRSIHGPHATDCTKTINTQYSQLSRNRSPLCTTKSTLTGGDRLRDKSRKKPQTKLIYIITQSYYLKS